MKRLSGKEEKDAVQFFQHAIQIAQFATCNDAKCGAIIVKNNEIIGTGFNSPPGNLESQRRCSFQKTDCHSRITDKTCCVHAEERAILDAFKKNPEKLSGSRLYFVRVDGDGKMLKADGKPYCTICSKLTLDSGIAEFVLWNDVGISVYNTKEYNTISFQYTG